MTILITSSKLCSCRFLLSLLTVNLQDGSIDNDTRVDSCSAGSCQSQSPTLRSTATFSCGKLQASRSLRNTSWQKSRWLIPIWPVDMRMHWLKKPLIQVLQGITGEALGEATNINIIVPRIGECVHVSEILALLGDITSYRYGVTNCCESVSCFLQYEQKAREQGSDDARHVDLVVLSTETVP